LLNHQFVEKGQTLITYSGTISDVEIDNLSAQLAQLDRQISALTTLKKGLDTEEQVFEKADDFGYQSTLGNYLSQLEVTKKEFDKVNADIGNQNATLAKTQNAVTDEINALSQKIDKERDKYNAEKDKDKREQLQQTIDQLETSLSSLKTQQAGSGTYQSLDESLTSKLDNLKTAQLATADKELVVLRDKKQELAQNLVLAQETQKNNQIIAQESGIIKVDEENKNKKIIPPGTVIAEILPDITDKTDLEIDYYVDSSALTGLKKGQKIRFTSTKKLSEQLVMTGQIKEIAKSATPINGQNFFQIKADVHPKSGDRKKLIYGMQGRVSSIIDKKTFFDYYKDKFFGEG
jgi:hypothetical protein